MLNQVVIIGRLIANPEIKNLELEKSVSNITLAVLEYIKMKMVNMIQIL